MYNLIKIKCTTYCKERVIHNYSAKLGLVLLKRRKDFYITALKQPPF